MLPRKMRSHDRKQVHPPQSWVRSGHSNSHRLPNIGEDDAPHARGSGSSSPKSSPWGASRFPCRTNWKRGSTSMPAKTGSRSAASWPGQWRAFWMEEGSHRGLRTQPASKRQWTTWRGLRPMSRSSGAAWSSWGTGVLFGRPTDGSSRRPRRIHCRPGAAQPLTRST